MLFENVGNDGTQPIRFSVNIYLRECSSPAEYYKCKFATDRNGWSL